MPEHQALYKETAAHLSDGALTRTEHLALRVGHFINETQFGKTLQGFFLRGVAYRWMRASLARRMFVEGLDELAALTPERGVLLVCNHRSFFDLYTVIIAIWAVPIAWARHLYFPVRANFFYERLLGIVTNLVVGAGVMYPPIFRSRERAGANREALLKTSNFLRRRGCVVGMHPEGMRNKGEDPYTLLPAQPGVGEVALLTKPTVIPIFINGLSNSIPHDIRTNYRRGIRRTYPIICVIGKPIDCDDLFSQTHRPALRKQIADRFNAEIAKLGQRERELRAMCATGVIAENHPQWLTNRGAIRQKTSDQSA